MLHGAGDLRFEDLPMAGEVAPNHVRVQMRAVGICGSDVHFLKNVRLPMCCGSLAHQTSVAVVSNHQYCDALHLSAQGRMGSFEITEPLVVGHESAGCVFKLFARK